MKILIAEDHDGTRFTLGKILVEKGHDVKLAADGARAIELMNLSRFDLIISDLEMPKKNGFHVAKERESLCPHVPFLLFTAARYIESTFLDFMKVTKVINKSDCAAIFEFIEACEEFNEGSRNESITH